MDDLREYILTSIRWLAETGDENSFHNLIELGAGALPILTDLYYAEQSNEIRTAIVEVVSQIRDEASLSLLSDALSQAEASVWRAALDGLVTLGGPPALRVLRKERDAVDGVDPGKLTWVEEAIEQVGDRGHN